MRRFYTCVAAFYALTIALFLLARVLVTPSQRKPPSIDHRGWANRHVTFFSQRIGSATPGAKPCPYDAAHGIIDCSAQGYGPSHSIRFPADPTNGTAARC
jgi:hypothetical protein